MSGTISHSWNGTVLTITSDSGTSSADLKGDTGIRGPQGAAGIVDTNYVYTVANPPTAEEIGAVSKTILWENASPLWGFFIQEIPVDIKGYDAIEIISIISNSGTDGRQLSNTICLDIKNGAGSITSTIYYADGYGNTATAYSRAVTVFESGRVDGSKGSVNFDLPAITGTTYDSYAQTYLIPVRIYGVKQDEGVNHNAKSSTRKPLLLDDNITNLYLTDSSYGDEALQAIRQGRQILVKTPNADNGTYTVIYSPVYMYQLPNYSNNYLYLFYLTDNKQDLSALVGLPTGSVMMPVYGQLKMLLSKTYDYNPLEV